VLLEHENVPTGDGVKGQFEGHLGGVALEKAESLVSPSDLGPGCSDGGGRAIHADHLAALTNHLREQQARVAGTAADIEHAHSRFDARFAEESPRRRVDQPCLRSQPVQFVRGMAKRIVAA